MHTCSDLPVSETKHQGPVQWIWAGLPGRRLCARSGLPLWGATGRGQPLQGGAGAQGLVDFLVLAQSGAFVGFGPSTYSFFLSEYRTLQGMATARSVLVDGSKIGTGATAF